MRPARTLTTMGSSPWTKSSRWKKPAFPIRPCWRDCKATGQVFELTSEQQQFLTSHGVSQNVLNQMQDLNRDTHDQLMNQPGEVISRPPVQP